MANDTARPKTAVLLRHIGIGDLIWHLPYIRALASSSANGKVTVIAAPTTLADQILSTEDCVDQVVFYDRNRRRNDGTGVHRGFRGLFAFAAELRTMHFERIYMFSGRYHHGMLAWLAKIPVRAAYGRGRVQRLLLNRSPYIDKYVGPAVSQYEEAVAFALAHGLVDNHVVPRMRVPAMSVAFGRAAVATLPRPRVALTVGSSQPSKHWGDAHYAELARQLTSAGYGVVLLAGPGERERVNGIVDAVAADPRKALAAFTDAQIVDVAGILLAVDCCAGNDTGVLNIAAAVGTPCVCVVGRRPLLLHDPLIRCLADAPLRNISPTAVFHGIEARIEGAAAAREAPVCEVLV